jgi:hypothetical protein
MADENRPKEQGQEKPRTLSRLGFRADLAAREVRAFTGCTWDDAEWPYGSLSEGVAVPFDGRRAAPVFAEEAA